MEMLHLWGETIVRSLCSLAPVVSVCMMQLEPWFNSWVPESVFSAGGGRSSVAAWYCTALDIEECWAGRGDSDVHLIVADVAHGIAASLLSQSCYLKLRASSVRACWSCKTTIDHAGTVPGVDLGFSIVLFCFRVLRRYLVYRPEERAGIGRVLALVREGPVDGKMHLLVRSAGKIGFSWRSDAFCSQTKTNKQTNKETNKSKTNERTNKQTNKRMPHHTIFVTAGGQGGLRADLRHGSQIGAVESGQTTTN